MKIKKILGPPGTGKTHRLLEQVEIELANGIDPSEIAFVTFTRRGAQEAVTRAVDKFNVSRNEFTWFRTIHSMAYRLLGLRDGDVMQFSDYRRLGKELGITFNFGVDADEAMAGSEEGDKLRALEELSRNKMQSYQQTWDAENIDVEWERFEYYCRGLERFKGENSKIDFTDMLEKVHDQGQTIDLRVAIIDEAQDLSRLQWEVLLQLFAGVDHMYIAGDDDQAIYRWSGADVDYFMGIEAEQEFLTKSYRCPDAVHTVAKSIVERIRNRIEKEWEPREAEGKAISLSHEHELEINPDENWYLLSRNRSGFRRWEDLLHEQAVPYLVKDKAYVRPEDLAAIRAWESWRKGNEVKEHDLRLAREMIVGKYEGDTFDWDNAPKDEAWFDVMRRLGDRRRRFYQEALRRGRDLDAIPRVRIDTIHGVKGGEADHVALLMDVGYLAWKSLQEGEDDEHRVFYVGVTRAREVLHLVEPSTEIHYEI